MVMSPEYPDLKWVQPRAWSNANRTSVQVVVIHTTEGSMRAESAEDGAAYDARRTDSTSTHYFHDSNSTVQCVRTEDIAYAALYNGNQRGIQHELCARAGTTDWSGEYSQDMLWVAARQVARDCMKWRIPARKLTAAQVAAGEKGLCGHVDITIAFPQDGGDHTDPGTRFPWFQFLAIVQAIIEGDTDMALADDMIVITEDTDKAAFGGDQPAGYKASAATLLQLTLIHAARAAASSRAASDSGKAILEEQKKTNILLAELVSLLKPTTPPAAAKK